MHKITYTDDQLKRASGVIARALEKSLPDPSECVAPFEYSQDFLDKMDKLIRKVRWRAAARFVAQRIAFVILVVLIGTSAWLTVDAEARAAFVSWVREVYEDSFIYRYSSEKPDEGLREYEITALPEGYELVMSECTDSMHIKLYQSGERVLMLMYHQFFDEREHIIVNEEALACDWEAVSVNGISADFYCYYDNSFANELFWIDEDINVAFQLSAFMEKEEMIRIAESIFEK